MTAAHSPDQSQPNPEKRLKEITTWYWHCVACNVDVERGTVHHCATKPVVPARGSVREAVEFAPWDVPKE